ncbi:hypothetical protein GN156_36680, partial [bacterium LRH843]|nr:hypothetical protein [bacterium LRH843]
LLLKQKLKTEQAYVPIVENSLNFASAQLQQVEKPVLDLTQFEQTIDQFTALDVAQIESLKDYYAPEGQYHAVLGKKWRTD